MIFSSPFVPLQRGILSSLEGGLRRVTRNVNLFYDNSSISMDFFFEKLNHFEARARWLKRFFSSIDISAKVRDSFSGK
jgi:hypothetical protein